jgi:putative ABC transport system permease protein
MVEYNAVGPRFHEVLGLPMLAGRGFDEHDDSSAPSVVVVNETLVRQFFAGRVPLGAHIMIDSIRATIVGVARDARYHDLNERPRPYVYFPILQVAASLGGTPTLIVRTSGSAAESVPSIVAAARSADAGVPVYRAVAMTDRLRVILAPQLAGTALLGVFSVLAVVIASLGIYGVVAYGVSQRTREIGIRIALGAQSDAILRLVVGRTAVFVGAGIVIGIAVAIPLGRAAAGFLYGVGSTDVATFAGTIGMMVLIAGAAAYLPARRAMRAEPLRALRTDG